MFTATGTVVFLLVASALVSLAIHVLLGDRDRKAVHAVSVQMRKQHARAIWRIDELDAKVESLTLAHDDSSRVADVERALRSQDLRLCTLEEGLRVTTGEVQRLDGKDKARDEAMRVAAAEAAEAEARDLKRIKGIGTVLERTLNDAGITTIDQVANLTIDQIETLSERLGNFADRIERDAWVEQARRLVQVDE